jgi:hypothetical protein
MENKSLRDKIVDVYPEIVTNGIFSQNLIILQNDSDGLGDYIAKWDYSKPIPEGLTLGKPSA